MSTAGLVVDETGVTRCSWASSSADYLAYHDQEWGVAVHGEARIFERLTLEAFQSGLSWLTILRKREGFRAAFAEFDAEAVAGFGEADHQRLMADTSIVRNRLKIRAAVTNAQAVLALRHEGGLDELLWSFAPIGRPRPRTSADVPVTSAESVALAKTLKHKGFVFVGPTTMYAAMQACGLVDDHVAGCFRGTG